MVVERSVNLAMPLAETAMLFHENGVDLIDWDQGNKYQFPMIRFHGDKAEGDRVMEVAKKVGLWPVALHQVWYYRYGLEKDPKWHLYFHYPPAEGQFDEAELDLLVASMSYTPLHRTLHLELTEPTSETAHIMYEKRMRKMLTHFGCEG